MDCNLSVILQVDRLCVAKHHDDDMPSKPHAVKLVYEDNKETYVPVKDVTKVWATTTLILVQFRWCFAVTCRDFATM